MNHEQSTSSMATKRTEITHGLAYSVSRVIEVTAWQSVSAVCLYSLTHGSCHWTRISSGYSNWGYGQHMPKRMAFIYPCYLHMTCSVCWTSLFAAVLARPDSQFLCRTRVYFCVIFCGARFSHILMTVMCIQLVHILHVHSLRLALQCHAFI